MGGFAIDPSGFSLYGESTGFGDTGLGDFSLPSQDYNFWDPGTGDINWGQGLNFGVPSLQSDNPFLSIPGSSYGNPVDQTLLQRIFQGTPSQNGQPGQPGAISQVAGVGLPAMGTAAGLAGIIQQMTMGRPTSQSQIRSTVQASPQQAQLTSQTMQALQNLQAQAQNQQLQQAISSLLAGNLPITPNLVDQVTKAFGGSVSGLMKTTAENARARGWHGTEGDVAMGAGSPVFAQGINDIENQVNQALVNLALGIPQAAANMQGQLVNQQMAPIQGMESLLGTMTNMAGLQGGRDVKTLNPQPNQFLASLPAIGQLASGLGQMGVGRQMMTQPPPQYTINLSGVS